MPGDRAHSSFLGDNRAMPDVGWGELLLLAGVALVIFGPDKLPKAAADAGRMVRKLREMANNAQQDIGSNIDLEGIKSDLRSVADLHPKRIIGSALSEVTGPGSAPAQPAPTRPAPATANDDLPAVATSDPRLDPDAT